MVQFHHNHNNMEPTQNNQNQQFSPRVDIQSSESASDRWHAPLTRVTTTSKVLAAIIFIALPFVGGYVGWQMAASSDKNLAHSVTSVLETNVNTLAEEIGSNSQVDTSIVLEDATLVLQPVAERFNNSKEVQCPEAIHQLSRFNNLEINSLVCKEGLSQDIDLVMLGAGCGGCGEHYLKTAAGAFRKLENFPYFMGVLYEKNDITNSFIGVTSENIFLYDFTTDTKTNLYSANQDERLLWCEHGCSADDQLISRVNNEIYFVTKVYDVSSGDFGTSYNSAKTKNIKIELP